MDGPDFKRLLAILLLVAAVGAGWYFRDTLLPKRDEPAVRLPKVTSDDAGTDKEPRFPVAPYEPRADTQVELVPLPSLDDSDSYFLLALVDVFGSAIEPLLVNEALIDRFVATVDNLPRNHVAEKVRPVRRLGGVFRTDTAASDGPVYLSTENFQRYDRLVSRITSADLNAVVDTYRRFYPLMQQSYERLGYPNAYFNDRVIEVIDHLLDTPEVQEPIELVRPHVLYQFADPGLEARSSGQKLLLRMGSEHVAVIKRMLRELRTQLAQRQAAFLPAEAKLDSDRDHVAIDAVEFVARPVADQRKVRRDVDLGAAAEVGVLIARYVDREAVDFHVGVPEEHAAAAVQ